MQKQYIFVIIIIILFPSYNFAENNLLLYMNNGTTINAGLSEITDSTFILVKEHFAEDDDTIKISKNNIRKIIIPDSAILSAPMIEIHTYNSIIEDIVLTGIDMENNQMFYAVYDAFDDEISRRDTLNLADTNVKMIVVLGASNIISGIFGGTGIGLVGGFLTGGFIGAATSDVWSILLGILVGGTIGSVSGLIIGTIVGIATSSSDMEIGNMKLLKNELLNFIQYPNLIYYPEE